MTNRRDGNQNPQADNNHFNKDSRFTKIVDFRFFTFNKSCNYYNLGDRHPATIWDVLHERLGAYLDHC